LLGLRLNGLLWLDNDNIAFGGLGFRISLTVSLDLFGGVSGFGN
jgi:hypothetical protein